MDSGPRFRACAGMTITDDRRPQSLHPRQHTPKPVPHVPEIALYVADKWVPMWEKTEEELGAIGLPPPYWAFAWAGGQALARHVLDHPDIVAGKRVLDLAAGSGLVAIAAAKAGAAPVIAADIDAFTEAAIALNTEANNVYVEILMQDLLDRPAPELARRRHPGRATCSTSATPRRARSPFLIATPGRRARADRRSRPHLSAEGAPHPARRIFRAGDARAGGHGDQADQRMGAFRSPRVGTNPRRKCDIACLVAVRSRIA